MHSMNTCGALTRSRGMTEQQRLTWLLAMPACAEVNRAMQELSGAKYSTNEQNKETGKSRQRRDKKDTHNLLLTISERNPFAESTSLRNIITGVNATGDVYVCRTKEIGQKIFGLDDGHSSGAAHVQTQWPGDDTSVEVISSRWWTADTHRPRAPVPTPHCRMQCHWRQKSVIPFRLSLTTHSCREHHRKPFWRTPYRPVCYQTLPDQLARFNVFVLDGGVLLHRITWPHGFPTYQEICALYCDYLSRNFGPAIVVFDGYRIPSAKYTTHQRRTGGKVGIEVTFTGDVKLTIPKDVFLSNVAKKNTSSTRWVTTCSWLDVSQNTRRRMPTCWLRKQQCNRQLRRTLSSWPTIPIWSSCYATTQIQMASTCPCSFRHGGQRRRTASGISKSPKVSWVLTSATTSCSYTRHWGVIPHPDYMVSEKDCRWRDSPPVRCSEIRLNSSARRTQQLTTS